MIYPIVAYGDGVLKKKAEAINPDYPELKALIESIYETMDNASGVGLAAPQIGLAIRLFVVDAEPFDPENYKGYRKVFINAKILEQKGEKVSFNEGCLSIPGVRENVIRHDQIVIEYFDENFVKHTETIKGLASRIIQHEYDHIEGVLFIDRISTFKRSLILKKLMDISQGIVKADYRMKFPKLKKRR